MIELTNLCETFHAMPYAGGIYDQPADLVDGMIAVLMAQNEKENLKKPRGKH